MPCEVPGLNPGGYHQHITRKALGGELCRLSGDALLERRDSKVMDFVSAPETIARWVQRNRCQPAPRRVLE